MVFQVKSNGVRLLLLSEDRSEIWALDEIQFTRQIEVHEQTEQFQHFVSSSVLSEARVKRIFFIHDSEKFTVLPNHLFSPDGAAETLGLVADHIETKFVFSDSLADEALTVIYQVPGQWKEWSDQVFSSSETRWQSAVSGQIQRALELSAEKEEPLLSAHIEAGHVVLIAASGRQLLFANRFSYATESDLLYFVLLALEESKIPPDTGRIVLSGSILPGSLAFDKLARYIGRLSFAQSNTEMYVPFGFDSIQHHNYFDLLSLPATIG